MKMKNLIQMKVFDEPGLQTDPSIFANSPFNIDESALQQHITFSKTQSYDDQNSKTISNGPSDEKDHSL